jgi:hypothetical protein
MGGLPQEELVFDSPDKLGEPSKTEHGELALHEGVLGFVWAGSCSRTCAGSLYAQVCVGLLRFLLEAWFSCRFDVI